jgi:hypothetical protein
MIVNKDGDLLGIVTSNARHNQKNDEGIKKSVLIPSLNFGIPITKFDYILKFLKNNGFFLF